MLLCSIFGHKSAPHPYYIMNGTMYRKCERCGKDYAATEAEVMSWAKEETEAYIWFLNNNVT